MDAHFDAEKAFSGKFAEEYEKAKKEIQKVSILVMGGSGVGKSTLVNTVFKKEVARAGAGMPVTSGIHLYENDYLRLYDSEGYESGTKNQERYAALLKEFFAEKGRDASTFIHLCWYCVSAPSARFTDCDCSILRSIPKSIPTAVVLTQTDRATREQVAALKEAIKKEYHDLPVFLAMDKEHPKSEVEALDHWSRDHLPEAQRKAYLFYSNRNIDAKEDAAQTIILQHCAAAFGAGFAPVPFSDAPLLLANQAGMVARVCKVWDLSSLVEVIKTSGALATVISTLGKGIAGNLLKLIPGLGTIVGGMIKGTVAAALTYGLGTAVNKLCRIMTEHQRDGKPFDLEKYISTEMVGILKKAFEDYMNTPSMHVNQ